MISLIIGIMVSLVVTIVGTPLLIKLVHKLNYGQYIRQDGPKSHLVKRGTPTLGGVVINLAVVLASVLLGTVSVPHQGRGAVVVRGIGAVRHAVDGILGIHRRFREGPQEAERGTDVKGKFIGQFILATIYAVLALILPTNPASPAPRPA